jgi:hypothetical protein
MHMISGLYNITNDLQSNLIDHQRSLVLLNRVRAD